MLAKDEWLVPLASQFNTQTGHAKISPPTSLQSSTQKKPRKVNGKKVGGVSMNLSQTAQKGGLAALDDRYKDLEGATEWFMVKRQELESQKKSTAGLPHHQQWKPPRIDQEKYQCAPIEQFKQPMKINPQSQLLNNSNLYKRLRRSNSSDNINSDFEMRPVRRVKYDGDLLLNQSDHACSPIQKVDGTQRYNEEVLVYSVKDHRNQDDAQLKDYLELSDFIVKEATSSGCNGVWLKGSMSGYIERALHLLHDYDYSFTLAKFHLLYPSIMTIPDRRQEIMASLSEKEIEGLVQDAIIDLRGCKTQEAEEAISNIRTALENRVTVEELSYYQQVLKKLRVDMPQDIEVVITQSKEFSKQIKKKCGPQTGGGAASTMSQDKKLKMNELLALHEEALTYPIITPEMQQLNDYIKKANQWIEKAELIKSQVVNVKQLQNLLQEARSIPVNFEKLFEDLKKRSNESQALIDKIYNTFIKVTKTRTQVTIEQQKEQQQQLTTQSSFSNGRRKSVLLENKKDAQQSQERREKEELFRNLLKEADTLKITNSEVQKLREHMEEIDLWKTRVQMFLEDSEKQQMWNKEMFAAFMKETSLFKIELDLTEDLQKRLEYIEWHQKVLDIYEKAISSNQMNDDLSTHWITIEELQSIMQDGESKGFTDLQLPEIQSLADLCIKIHRFQKEIQRLMNTIRGSKFTLDSDGIELETVINMRSQTKDWRVQVDEIQELDLIIKEALQIKKRCDQVLNEASSMNDIDQINLKTELKDLLTLRSQVKKLNLRDSSFKDYCAHVKPLLRWIKYSRQIIKAYYKTLDLQMNQLNLMEQQDYESDGERMPRQEYEIMATLMKQAEGQLSIVKCTRDFSILQDMYNRVLNWQTKALTLEQNLTKKYESQPNTDLLDQLEKLIQESLPLPQDLLHRLQSILKKEKWMRKVQDIYASDKIKLKLLESGVKESQHAEIQDDERCSTLAESLREQLKLCREWIEVQQRSSLKDQSHINKLLEMGKQLKVNLVDYVELKLFNQDMIEWRNRSHQILNGPQTRENNYEAVRRHIDLGKELEIDDKEIRLLRELVEVCAHWKSIARKLLTSRPLSKLKTIQPIQEKPNQDQDKLNQDDSELNQSQESQCKIGLSLILQKTLDGTFIIEEVKMDDQIVEQKQSTPQNQFFDNHQYCICRRGDDGLVFMIECDVCKEWFHGNCIGMSAHVTENLATQYVCIGCARLVYGFDPNNPQPIVDDNGMQLCDPNLLKTFSSIKRASYEFFILVVQEGESLPLYLEELQELVNFKAKIQQWSAKVEKVFDQEVNNTEEEPEFIDEEDSSEIISTKTQQKGSSKEQQLEDEIKYIHQLYLESESFPCDMEEAEDLMNLLRKKRWYIDALRVISGVKGGYASSSTSQQNKVNKSQMKRSIKRLIAQAQDLRFENEWDYQHILEQAQIIKELSL